MIEYRIKDVHKGDILFLPAMSNGHTFSILVEVLDVRHYETNTHVEVTPIAGDGSCIWVDGKQLREKWVVER